MEGRKQGREEARKGGSKEGRETGKKKKGWRGRGKGGREGKKKGRSALLQVNTQAVDKVAGRPYLFILGSLWVCCGL